MKFSKDNLIKTVSILTLFFIIQISGFVITCAIAAPPSGSPTKLTAATSGTTAILLNWVYTSSTQTGFKVDRAANSAFTSLKLTYTIIGSGIRSYSHTSGITEGSGYYYRVYAYNAEGNSGFSNIIFGTSYLKTPTNLTAALTAATTAKLDWTDVSLAETNYVLERKTASTGTYATLITLTAGTQSYTDSTLSYGQTYYYRVKATKTTNGAYSLYSNETQVTTGQSLILNPPGNLIAAATDQVVLSWADTSTNEDGFKIEKSLNQYSGFTVIGTAAAEAVTFTDTNVAETTQYYYRVRAFSGSNFSNYSQVANCTTYLKTPGYLTVGTETLPNYVGLRWEDNSLLESNYAVERKTPGGSWLTVIDSLPANSTDYIDNVSYDSFQYIYRIRATNPAVSAISLYSNEATVNIPEIELIQEAPDTVTEGLELPYTIRVINHSSRQIQDINISDQLSNQLQLVNVSIGSVDVSGLFTCTIPLDSYETKQIQITTRVPNQIAAPSVLTALRTMDNEITLEWQDNSNNEEGFMLERSTRSDFTENITVTGINSNTNRYIDAWFSSATLYYYRIKAYRSIDSSAYSNIASASSSPIAIETPGLLYHRYISFDSPAEIHLSWKDRSNNEDSFKIERSTSPDFNANLVIFTAISGADVYPDSGDQRYIDNTVIPGQTYYYRVRAFSAPNLYSAYSNILTISLYLPQTPSNLQAAVYHTSNIMLTWQDNSDNEMFFDIERSTSPDFNTELTSVGCPQPNSTTYEDKAVPPGQVYYYRIRAISDYGDSVFSNYASATAQLDLSIASPTNLEVISTTSDSVYLRWQDNSDNEDGFMLEQSESPDFSSIRDILENEISANQNSYLVNIVIENHTYYYRLRARRLPDYYSGLSNVVYAATSSGITIAAPTGLTGSAIALNQIQLNWVDNSDNENSFIIERGLDGNFNNPIQIVIDHSDVTTFIDNGVTSGTTYFYRIRAYNSTPPGYYSAWSAPASVNIANPAVQAPSNLTATATLDYKISLTWQDNSSDEDGFIIERNENSSFTPASGFNPVVLGPGVTSFIDGQAIPNTTHYYRVRSFKGTPPSIYSGYSNTAFTTTLTIPITAPSNLTATANGTSVILNWSDNSNNEDYFFIERSLDNSFNNPYLFTVERNTTTTTDNNLTPNTTYYYRIKAFNGTQPGFNSAWSSPPASVNTGSAIVVQAPSNLTATANGTSAILIWVDNSGNEDSFSIERSLNVSFTGVHTIGVAKDTTTFTDYGLTPDTTYYYRIKAYNGTPPGFNSAWSSPPASVNTGSAIVVQAPSNLTATVNGYTSIILNWADNSNNEDYFFIERSLDNSFNNPYLFTVERNTTTTTDNNLTPNTTYYYRIKAFNGTQPGFYSSWSNTAFTSTTNMTIQAPGNLTAAPNGAYAIVLSWSDNSNNEDSFAIERGLDNNFNNPQKLTVANNSTTYTDVNLTPNTTYYYRIRAFNGTLPGFYSGWSNTASARTKTSTVQAPGNLTATATLDYKISLTWQDNSSDEDGFIIERNENSSFTPASGFNPVVLGPGVTSFIDGQAIPNTTHYYRVRSFKGTPPSIYSGYSNTAFTTTLTIPITAPSNLRVHLIFGYLIVEWQDNSDNEDIFYVQKSLDPGFSNVTLAAGNNAAFFEITDIGFNTRNYFRARAVKYPDFYSGWSEVISVSIHPNLTIPASLVATKLSGTSLKLDWQDNSGDYDGFIVQQSESSDFATGLMFYTSQRSCEINNLSPGKIYYFKVQAYRNVQNGQQFDFYYSNYSSVTPMQM